MRLTRIYADCRLSSGAEAALPAAGGHHVSRVLRLKEGARLIVFDGTGGEYRAEISRVAAGRVHVLIGDFVPETAVPPLHLTLIQGVSRGERMDWTLQKATELGVATIVPVLTARTIVRLDEKQGGKKQDHWQAIVVGACEQCGRTRIPEIAAPVPLRDFLKLPGDGLRLALSPSATGSLTELAEVPQRVELLIGPEGGLDEEELELARQSDFIPVRLGPRVLRTETAAVVALSVLQALWGDLQ